MVLVESKEKGKYATKEKGKYATMMAAWWYMVILHRAWFTIIIVQR